MLQVELETLRSEFSAWFARVVSGETLVICDHDRPVAELRPCVPASAHPRPLGLGAGQAQIHDDFAQPLPADVLAGFLGGQ